MKKPKKVKPFLFFVKRGVRYFLKVCKDCGDEWYALPKHNRCSLCGGGTIRLRRGDDPDALTHLTQVAANMKMLQQAGVVLIK